jgi:hypothetical protein
MYANTYSSRSFNEKDSNGFKKFNSKTLIHYCQIIGDPHIAVIIFN